MSLTIPVLESWTWPWPIWTGTSTPLHSGVLRAVVTGDLVEQLAAAGLCVAPDDDVVIVGLKALLQDVKQLDLLLFDVRGKRYAHLQNIPFNRAAAHVLVAPNVERLRELPQSTARFQLVASEPGRLSVIGNYTVTHAPWANG
jgi:hypothetical protein